MKGILILLMLLISIPQITFARNNSQDVDLQVAFLRDQNLWLLEDGEEKQITFSGNVVGSPQWSYDGQWILYEMEKDEGQAHHEIWIYRPQDQKEKRIHHNGYQPKWAPDQNLVSFIEQEVLSVSDLDAFFNVAAGVNDVLWLPKHNELLLSTNAKPEPNGWTNPILFKKTLPEQLKNIELYEAEAFLTIPKELQKNNTKIISIQTGSFALSPSKKWISFIVSPTASWSMDSNMLCLVSSDGKTFEVLDEVIFGVGEPKWAPSKDTIAYIAGGGRIVYGFKNKRLKLKELPTTGTLTPKNYAELDFTWIDNESIVTSRVMEKEWSNNVKEQPLPALYKVMINSSKQTKMTNPPKGFGDYHPTYSKAANKLIWYRGRHLIDENRDVWIANKDGSDMKKWLENVDEVVFDEHEE